jgi:hypothetical protein
VVGLSQIGVIVLLFGLFMLFGISFATAIFIDLPYGLNLIERTPETSNRIGLLILGSGIVFTSLGAYIFMIGRPRRRRRVV